MIQEANVCDLTMKMVKRIMSIGKKKIYIMQDHITPLWKID